MCGGPARIEGNGPLGFLTGALERTVRVRHTHIKIGTSRGPRLYPDESDTQMTLLDSLLHPGMIR